MKIPLSLNGRINKDVNLAYINSQKGEVTERRNCRISSTGDALVNVSLKGMSSIGTTTGLGTVVGFTEDKKRNWGISFLKDGTTGRIYAYSTDTDTVIKILDNNFTFFNFGDHVEASVVDDFLIWTDNVNPVRYISLTRARNYSLGTGTWKETYQEITDLNTRFAIPTPTDNLTATWGYDTNFNNLKGKTWQFAVQYSYKDYEKSVLSSYSPLYVHPSLVLYPDVNMVSENYLQISVPMGGSEVVASTLLARENQGLWYKVKEFKKTAHNDSPVTYKFYDNTVREYITADLSALPNQNTPLRAGHVETSKNRLILGDITTNYNHPEVTLGLSYVPEYVNYSDSLSDTLSVAVKTTVTPNTIVINATGLTVSNGTVVHLGVDAVRDVNVAVTGSTNNFNAKFSFILNCAHLCTSSSVTEVLTNFVTAINSIAEDAVYNINIYSNPETGAETLCFKPFATRVGNTIEITFVNLFPSTHDITQNTLLIISEYSFSRTISQQADVNTFIGGSSYDVGVECYDELGNTSGVEGLESIAIPYDEQVYDNTIAIKQYKLNHIGVSLSGTPPSWATKYRLVCSKSTSFASVSSFTAGGGYITERDNKLVMAVSMPKDFSYAMSEGDFVNAKFKTKIGYSGFSERNIPVLGQASTVIFNGDTIISGNFLLLDTLNTALKVVGAVISIYEPLKEKQENIYFHATPLYDITGGAYSTASFTLKTGDAWLQRKIYNYTVKEETILEKSIQTSLNAINADVAKAFGRDIKEELLKLEEKQKHYYTFNPSFVENTQLGNSVSNANLGKPTVSLKDFKQEKLQELWAGGQIIANTQINELRDFSTSIKVALSETDGIIKGLRMAGDVLKVLQDNKETSVYIGIEKITNADGTMQLVSSSGFFGTVNRFDTEYGSQHTESIVSNERDVYYFDLDNACVVRSSPNGQFPISSYGFTSYFRDRAKEINDCIIAGTSYKVKAYFDRKYREYVIVFSLPNLKEAVVFTEGDDGWFYSIDLTKSGAIPDMIGSVGQQVVLFTEGTLWLNDRTTTYNSLFGENKEFLVKGVVNVSPSQEKCLKSLDLDSSEGLNTTITVPVTLNNIIGQETILYAESYIPRQGKLVSEVYQNIRLANGTNSLDQLYIGDDIQGKTIEIELSKTANTRIELRSLIATVLGEH